MWGLAQPIHADAYAYNSHRRSVQICPTKNFHLPLAHCQSLDQRWLCNEYNLTFDGLLSDNQLIPHIRHTTHELLLEDDCINAGRGHAYLQINVIS